MADIIVYIEHDDDGITDTSLQAVTCGRRLADTQDLKLGCAILGNNLDEKVAQLTGCGVDVVYKAANPQLAAYLPRPHAAVLAAIAADKAAKLVLLPASTVGNDLAPRTAGVLDTAAVLDCRELSCEDGAVVCKRVEFDAKVKTAYRAAVDCVSIVSVQDGIAEAAATGSGSAETVDFPVSIDETNLKTRIDRREVARKTVNLKDAKIIIGGGAGVGSAENFQLLEALAEKINAEIGATRAAVDAGWVSAERQIGQTGVNVAPDLYIACGISGAVQHLVGIREAKQIIAINTDDSAPIFKIANYKIVGDLADVVPKLTELID